MESEKAFDVHLLKESNSREGNMTFSQSGVVLGKNQKAGIEGTCLVACSRALMSVANVTVPLQLISLFERNNMVFFTPLKGMIFTGGLFFFS